jgi:hypothetical protein
MSFTGSINKILEERIQAEEEAIAQGKNPDSIFPQYFSGARAYVTISGELLAVCQDFNYTIDFVPEETRTIDSHLPWDISVGQVSIRASLRQLVNPSESPESQGLWSNMASIIHQPLIELEVFDKLGQKMFLARGMFTRISGNVSVGSLANRNVDFVGIAYAHNVTQSFVPYKSQKK